MRNSKLMLAFGTIAINICLWAMYSQQGLNERDFGSFPRSLRIYSLLAFGVSYFCNLAFLMVMLQKKTIPDNTYYVALMCVVLYYALQMAFIPCVRISKKTSKWFVRLLLLLCIFPIAILAGIGVELNDWLLSLLGIIVLLHVCINDAILFGFLF